jgi:hypothetical protein
MTFRAQLTTDLAVFLAPGEFGEAVVIDGVAVTAVRDGDLLTPRTRGPQQAEGIFARRMVLYLATGQIPQPVEGQRLNVDGQYWYARQVSEAEGMLELILERQEV